MTARDDKSRRHNEHDIVAHTGLPSAFEFLLYSLNLTKRYASDVYGFAAYLLFPMILYVGVHGIAGTAGEVAMSVVNVIFILISCWATAAIITLTSMRALHPKKSPDPRSVGMYALSTLSTLVFALLLVGIIEAAGYILFIIPGIAVSVFFTFTAQEVVLRGHGPISALAASRSRVQPQFFPILWRLFVLFFTAALLYFTCISILLWFASLALSVDILSLVNTTPLWLDAVLSLLQVLFLPPLVIAHTILYLASDTTPHSSHDVSDEIPQ